MILVCFCKNIIYFYKILYIIKTFSICDKFSNLKNLDIFNIDKYRISNVKSF